MGGSRWNVTLPKNALLSLYWAQAVNLRLAQAQDSACRLPRELIRPRAVGGVQLEGAFRF